MPLNLTTADADFTPYIKYNAKAGRFYIRPQGSPSDVEIVNPRLVFDMANIKTGYLFYAEGSGPEKVWDPSPTQMAAKPPGPRKFKRGFEVMVFGGDDIPGIGKLGLRELSSTASNVITAILKMHAEYERDAPKNPGKVPFFRCTGVLPVAGAFGTNYEPEFKLMGWVERAKIPAFDEALEREGVVGARGAADMPFDAGFNPGNGVAYNERNPPPRTHDLDDEIPF